ncbi:hypothetical protein [Streptomyces gobiensis]|uniref:hypothetical protein n=1 Tax=Streptomyces gobiensis TaxID=2875706 RepID=UPI001E590B8C|nr:hypothetical protein [Streptomyces gobiensis]UGY90740.1 hypothetical protein test1122_02695 [Streptomyces gobiensis]
MRYENLPEELVQALRTGPFHEALRAAIAARGLALHRIRHRLAQRGVTVGVTSLSYWQQGARRPARAESLRAVPALEEILEVPRDALVRLLEPELRTERPVSRSYRSLLDPHAALSELLTELGAPSDGGLHTVCHLERVRIGAGRELVERESQQVVRAHRDGVDRCVAIHRGDPGCDPARVRVRAGENCRVGSVRWHGTAGVVVAELLFDARLRAGDTQLFSYTFQDGTAGPSSEYVRGFRFMGGQYVLQVRFDPAVLPVHCHRFARTSAGARPSAREELTLTGRHPTVHLVEQEVHRRILGIGWRWA